MSREIFQYLAWLWIFAGFEGYLVQCCPGWRGGCASQGARLRCSAPFYGSNRWLTLGLKLGLEAMVRGAGGDDGDADGEGGSAFGGTARPGSSLGDVLPGVGLFLGEGELLF